MTRSYNYVDLNAGKVFVIPAFLEYTVLAYGDSIIFMNDDELQGLLDAGECSEYCTLEDLHKLQVFLNSNKEYKFNDASRVFEVDDGRFALCDGDEPSDWDCPDMDIDFLCDSNNIRVYLPAVYIYARR